MKIKKIGNAKISVKEYDADKDKDMVKKYNVSGYPSYLLQVDDGKSAPKTISHNGGRSVDDLEKLCNRHA